MSAILVGVGLAAVGGFVGVMIGDATIPPVPADLVAALMAPTAWGLDRVVIGGLVGATVGLGVWVIWLALTTLGRRTPVSD